MKVGKRRHRAKRRPQTRTERFGSHKLTRRPHADDSENHVCTELHECPRLLKSPSLHEAVSLGNDTSRQTKTASVAAATQHPPLPQLLVYNPSMIASEKEGFFVDLLLSGTPTARQVKAAVAAYLAVSSAEVTLQRRIGRRARQKLFFVFDDRSGRFGYADTAGSWSDDLEVKEDIEDLQDSDPFPLIPGFRNDVTLLPS